MMDVQNERTKLLSSTSSNVEVTGSQKLERNLTLFNTTAIIIASIIGSGIFISPSGVTENVGSIGASLIVWLLAGIFNLVLALCYAELGTALPVSGGDYVYVQKILGPVPAFMCLWSSMAMAAGACALMARTMSLYMFQLLGLECHEWLLVGAGLWFHLSFALLNSVSSLWSTRIVSVFSLAKLAAMIIIIVTGGVQILQGNLKNFKDVFKGTRLDAGSLAVGFVPGFVSCNGWESVSAMAGEMKNPRRDLPLSLFLGVTTVTLVYLMANVSYFTVLTPAEFVASDAVALTFAEKTLYGMKWIIPFAVSTAAAGSMNVNYLMFPRYLYAGGKDGQLPVFLSYLSIWYGTPLAGVLVVFLLSASLTAAIFIDVQGIIQILGVVSQVKIALALLSLLHLKRTHPHLPRALTMPGVVVVICFVLITAIITLSIYSRPFENLLGTLFFLAGYPICMLARCGARLNSVNNMMDRMTQVVQQTLLIVP